MSTAAQNKQPTLRREPLVPELIIPDLKVMEGSGNYNRNVLLWLQDNYVAKAMEKHAGDLHEMHAALTSAGESRDDIRTEKMKALIGFTRDVYKQEKAEGRGAGLKTYLEAANTFFETESARYGSHLQEIAEYVQKALANGEHPDVEKYARHAYVSMSKISGAMTQLESLNGRPAAQQVATYMKRGIEQIHFATVGDQPPTVGRVLLKFVEKISQNPGKYIEFRDPASIPMPERGPWDFEPIQRQSSHTVGY